MSRARCCSCVGSVRGKDKITRDDLAWEIQEEVEAQVQALTGLNQEARGLYRDENVFEDADVQMAGYAAALRTLTRYARIDGRDMTSEAIRPRVKNETTFVDGLIAFAVDTANQCLVPQGIANSLWEKLSGAERFYLKMLDLEARGVKTLDNYQNFAKAFKVRDFRALMGDKRANQACLKGAAEFGRTEMSEGSELHGSVLRAVLYAVMELLAEVDTTEVLAHLTHNVPDYYGDLTQRERAIAVAEYLAEQVKTLRSDGGEQGPDSGRGSAQPAGRVRWTHCARFSSAPATTGSRISERATATARQPTVGSPATSAAPYSSWSVRRSRRSPRCRLSATASWMLRTS